MIVSMGSPPGDRPPPPGMPPEPWNPPDRASPDPRPPQPKADADSSLAPVYEINERCIDLLVEAARDDKHPAPGLVVALRTPLLQLTPEMRMRVARRALLLVDLGFRDIAWWKDAQRDPQRSTRTPVTLDTFPARAAMTLARSTLILAWHSIRADRTAAGLMLGISRPVADVILSLPLTDLDRIAEKRFRRLRPRWEDCPALWRQLLLSVEATDFRKEREFNLRALQLVAGQLALAVPDT